MSKEQVSKDDENDYGMTKPASMPKVGKIDDDDDGGGGDDDDGGGGDDDDDDADDDDDDVDDGDIIIIDLIVNLYYQ